MLRQNSPDLQTQTAQQQSDAKTCAPISLVYDESDPKVVALYEQNMRQIPEMLRLLANNIENGDYGEVGEATCVVMGDTLEVFGWGPHCDGTSSAVMLQAGAQKLIDQVKNHGIRH